MSTKNLLNNLKNNRRLIIVILLIMPCACRYQDISRS